MPLEPARRSAGAITVGGTNRAFGRLVYPLGVSHRRSSGNRSRASRGPLPMARLCGPPVSFLPRLHWQVPSVSVSYGFARSISACRRVLCTIVPKLFRGTRILRDNCSTEADGARSGFRVAAALVTPGAGQDAREAIGTGGTAGTSVARSGLPGAAGQGEDGEAGLHWPRSGPASRGLSPVPRPRGHDPDTQTFRPTRTGRCWPPWPSAGNICNRT